MLPDRWTGDIGVVCGEVERVWGKPEREEEILLWLQGRTPRAWACIDESQRGFLLVRCDDVATWMPLLLARGARTRAGGLGAKEAVPIAQQLLDHPDPFLRATAIEVLALRMQRPERLLLDLLRRCHGPELRPVRRGLLLNRVRVEDRDLAVLREGDGEQRVTAWRLGMARGRWERLLADLLTCRTCLTILWS